MGLADAETARAVSIDRILYATLHDFRYVYCGIQYQVHRASHVLHWCNILLQVLYLQEMESGNAGGNDTSNDQLIMENEWYTSCASDLAGDIHLDFFAFM
jgi:hypothetical protein